LSFVFRQQKTRGCIKSGGFQGGQESPSKLFLKQPLRARQVAGLRPALDVEPPEQAPQMDFDGVLADLELFCNVAVAQAFV
jgi:hypothetical protein